MRALKSLRDARDKDPLLHALLTAPEDDQPLSSEEQAALGRTLEEARLGQTKRWEQVRGSIE